MRILLPMLCWMLVAVTGLGKCCFDFKWQQERAVPGVNGVTTAPATLTEYDTSGRVAKVSRWPGVGLTPCNGVMAMGSTTVTSAETGYRVRDSQAAIFQYFSVQNTGVVASITRHEYDQAGRLTNTMNPRGYLTAYSYDAAGRKTNVNAYQTPIDVNAASLTPVDNKRVTTSYGYDGNGNQVWMVDPAGHRTDYVYDGLNRLVQTIFPADASGVRASRLTVYNNLGQRVQEIDEAGVVTLFGYDNLGRLNAVVNDYKEVVVDDISAATVDAFIATLYGEWLKRDTDQTTLDQYILAKLDKMYDFSTPVPADLHAQGQQVIADLLKDPALCLKSPLPRISATSGAQGSGLEYINRTILHNAYSAFPAYPSPVTLYRYDEFGNLVCQIDANFNITAFEYDAFGRRTSRTLPDGTSESVTYSADPVGSYFTRRETAVGFDGKTTTRYYDNMERLASVVLPGAAVAATTITYGYDLNSGALQSVVMTGGVNRTVNYYYDPLRRLNFKAAPEGLLAYGYNAAGQIQNIDGYRPGSTVNSNGVVTGTKDVSLTYDYDSLGRLYQATDNFGSVTATYGYDPNGNLDHFSYPNGILHTYSYDNRNRLMNLSINLGSTSGALRRGYAYTLDATGRRTGVVETPAVGAGIQRRRAAYTYDGPALPRLGRLTEEDRYNATDGLDSSGSYGYDWVGNRLVNNGVTTTFDVRDLIDPDALPNNLNPNYDPNGNTTTDSAHTYQYDAQNHLYSRKTGSTVDLVMNYDAEGNRISKTVSGTPTTSTYYLVDNVNPTGYPQVLAEYTSLSGSTGPTVTYVYGSSLISQKRGSVVSYYCYDGQGSVRQLTDTAGTETDTYDYDAYGVQIAQQARVSGSLQAVSIGNGSPSTINNFRYTGQQWDADLGMYYLRARYYKPETGRFWTMDTYEGRQSDPGSLHKYLYCVDDPVNRIDPSGNESLASINVSSFIMGQMLTHESKGAEAALTKARAMFGGNDPGLDQIIMGLSMINTTTDTVGDFQMAGMGVVGAIKGYQMLKRLCTNPAVQRTAMKILQRIVAKAARHSSGSVRVNMEDAARVLASTPDAEGFVGIVLKDGTVKIFKLGENGIFGHGDLVRAGIAKRGETLGFSVGLVGGKNTPEVTNLSELNVHVNKDGLLPPEVHQQLKLLFGADQ